MRILLARLGNHGRRGSGACGRLAHLLRWCGIALIAGGVLMVVATLLHPSRETATTIIASESRLVAAHVVYTLRLVAGAAGPSRHLCGPGGIVAAYGSRISQKVAMRESWEILTAGPPDAARSVLLLPGGAMAARSFNLVMAQPTVCSVRLIATTLPGMAGAPLAEDVSIPGLARRAGELAKENGCDVVVGFSHGATVALEMVLSGHFPAQWCFSG